MADAGIWREMARVHWAMACMARTRVAKQCHVMIAADCLSRALAAEASHDKEAAQESSDRSQN